MAVAKWDIAQARYLSDTQLSAIDMTLDGFSDVYIAHALSIDRKTLWRWKTHNHNYRLALHNARVQVHANAADRCQNLFLRATSVLAKFLDGSSDKDRLRAAQILLQTAARFLPPPEKPPAAPPADDCPAA
ncbi:MAG: hypothetical protein ABSC42_16055 [Tepidisphaeraceae bacterium]|jgi:hypothetical protein